jgi:hypothetical protein
VLTSASQHLAAKNKMNKPVVVTISVRNDMEDEGLLGFDPWPGNGAKERLRVKARARPLSSSEMPRLSRMVWMASIVMGGIKKPWVEQ